MNFLGIIPETSTSMAAGPSSGLPHYLHSVFSPSLLFMSSVPQIPGFYYDPEKRKYFKIVNGDQRLNSSYSNNTLRAKNRTEDFNLKRSKPHTKALSSLSITAHRYKTVPPDHQLNVSLGLTAPPISSPVHILSNLDSLEERSACRIWGTLEKDHVLVGRPGHRLMVYETLLFIRNGDPVFELVFEEKITVVSSSGHWTYVQWGQNDCRLLKWAFTNGKLRMEERSQFLLPSFHEIRENVLLPGMRMCGKLCADKLHLLTENRWLVVIDLTDFSLKRRLLTNVDRPILVPESSSFTLLVNIWYFILGKTLYIYDYHSEKCLKWNFSGHISFVFVAESKFENDTPTADSFCQFVIVTTTEVHMRTICSKEIKVVGSDGKFSIHNNNNSKPMVVQFGSEVIIEETPESYKVLNLNSLAVKDIRLPHLAAVDRSTFHILNLGGVHTVANHTMCFLQK